MPCFPTFVLPFRSSKLDALVAFDGTNYSVLRFHI